MNRKSVVLFLSMLALLRGTDALGQKQRVQFSYLSGIKKTSFDWSIAGNNDGRNPNILSELRWYELTSFSHRVDMKIPYKNWALDAHISKSFVIHGRVSDGDYMADDRKSVTAFHIYDADKGSQYVLLPGVSYRIKFFDRKTLLRIGLSYMYYGDKFYMLNLERALSEDKLKGLKNSYKTSWKGFGLYGDYERIITNRMTFMGRGEIGKLRYNAVADWKSREDFTSPNSFYHSSKRSFVLRAQLIIAYHLTKKMTSNIAGDFHYRSFGTGTDILYKKDGSIKFTQLNGGQLKDIYIQIGLSYSFPFNLVNKTAKQCEFTDNY